ncbi:hypothetical protein AKJ45_01320 [candidate division MSBL1 archaeon SCGC-AAA261F19]|uniref:Stage II sporulation protein M n=1 Tax=candidate division MSBL1 archaeon SCGC-AAA261F19 TaxID=1698275 RepID=A0A133VAR0_9EURY|nr:hypothetical protein AKJ45_01320 [candidate division MSBL1 archaeon SCGC-AAA261F19]
MSKEKQTPWQKRMGRSLGSSFPKAIHRNRLLLLGVAVAFIGLMGIAVYANSVGDNPIDDTIKKHTETQRRQMEGRAEEIQTAPELIGFVLRNNLWVVVQTVGLGVGFGVFPLYVLVINALTIGYIEATLNLPSVVALSLILPHGAIELPAIIIAIGCGVKLGIGATKSLIQKKTRPLRKSGKDIADLLPGVFLLLIIAGFIEGLLALVSGPIINYLKIGFGFLNLSIVLLWLTGNLTKT